MWIWNVLCSWLNLVVIEIPRLHFGIVISETMNFQLFQHFRYLIEAYGFDGWIVLSIYIYHCDNNEWNVNISSAPLPSKKTFTMLTSRCLSNGLWFNFRCKTTSVKQISRSYYTLICNNGNKIIYFSFSNFKDNFMLHLKLFIWTVFMDLIFNIITY